MLEPLLHVTQDLCANLAPEDRYQRLMAAARQTVPCDAIALLRLDGDVLVPVAVDGLRAEATGRRFVVSEHPRLAQVVAARGPIRFTDADLPDPFDGLFAAGGDPLARAHACVGCPLIVDGRVIGALTVEALSVPAFDHVTDATFAMLAALAAATMRTAVLIDALDLVAARNDVVAGQLLQDALERGGGELLGTSDAMVRIRDDIALLACSDLTALITGETGVGKELVARSIHAQSLRHTRPLIHVNCAALPESLAESELFGHVRGAFTGAVDHRAGKFEVADGGTLLLDEVGELPLAIQPKLLRVLQSGEVQRIGSDRTLHVDARVIAATNRDLAAEVRAGRFRSDLFYRLSVFPLYVPPLRERRGDIAVLSGHFLELARRRLGLGQLRLTRAARATLHDHDWPGNGRELEHALMRAALKASAGPRRATTVIDDAHLSLQEAKPTPKPAPAAPTSAASPPALREAVDAFTTQLISTTVAACGDNWAEAARRLGVHRGNLHRLATRLGVRPTT